MAGNPEFPSLQAAEKKLQALKELSQKGKIFYSYQAASYMKFKTVKWNTGSAAARFRDLVKDSKKYNPSLTKKLKKIEKKIKAASSQGWALPLKNKAAGLTVYKL